MTQKLGIEVHYTLWLETMFAQFGYCVFTGDQHGSMKLKKQENFQSHWNQAEVDITGSALQESLLNADEKVNDDSLKGVNERICSMSVTSSDASACSPSTTWLQATRKLLLMNINACPKSLDLWLWQREARYRIRISVNGEIPIHYSLFHQECETHSWDVWSNEALLPFKSMLF